MKGLTERQQAILDYILSYMEKEGHAPSLREAAEAFHITPAGVHYAYRVLEEKGAISLKNGIPRGLTLSKEERGRRENIAIPFYEKEPSPSDLEEEPKTRLYISKDHEGADYYSFRVTSSSMVHGGILPGDIAILRRQAKAEDGDIVLASAGQEEHLSMELRRLRKSRNSSELWSENDNMGIIRSQNVFIYGILFEIRRSY